ncbi:MAG: methyltransferase domain-containing protein [Dehalogenimonas sp.]|jgi:ubiquinone/menaquinone biosynthesis C-methylase UbiE|uniref:Methyltransferase domain-containing protein n=1 Tax=Candidatus Dehalogenimonas loeffleri TaxID=3127115 RepID=A0ABZ2J612_9CHLR|nr:methyltransferase domain-containing protein [Dehalogenimonas sp.]
MMARFYSLFIDRALKDLRKGIPEFAGMQPGEKVLDVCCGTGDQAMHIAGLGLEVYGIDLDERMIAVAEANKRRTRRENISFQTADAAALLFKSRSFDYATISLALHEKPPEIQLQVIEEMRRVVKKGGVLVLADFGVPAKWFIRLLEGLVGGDHYACFKAYQAAGGLEALTTKIGLKVEKRAAVMGGAVELRYIRN